MLAEGYTEEQFAEFQQKFAMAQQRMVEMGMMEEGGEENYGQ